MNKQDKYQAEYSKLIETYPFPVVYNFAKEYVQEDTDTDFIRLMPSNFYETSQSYASVSTKPISKIL